MIAISQRSDVNKHGALFDNLESSYIEYFEMFGAKLVPVPNALNDVKGYLEGFELNGIILSGGNDINPELYGEELRGNEMESKIRDETEWKLLEFAVERKIPVLGICRGMQFINVFFGGKLVRSIKEEIIGNVGHVAVMHKIAVIDEKARAMLGNELMSGNEAEVNSYHNQGVVKEKLSKELKAFAQTQDGMIEGIYHPKLPILGVQWHPERKNTDEKINEKIVNSFLEKRGFGDYEIIPL